MSSGTTTARDALRWAFLTCLMAAIAGFTGYFVGLVDAGEPKPRPPAKARTAAPALLPLAKVYGTARADGARVAADRAYVRGRLAGKREGRVAAQRELEARYRPRGEAYRRIVGRGRREALGKLRGGVLYELCRGGRALCERPAQRPASNN